jgi:hypothetical protein
MRLLAPAAALLAAFALAPAPAAAGSYVGLGIGKDAPLTGDLGRTFHTDDSRHARLMIGKRFGQLAIEGVLFGTEFSPQRGAGEFHTLSLGVDAKYYFGLTLNLNAFLKGGLHRTWISAGPEDPLLDSYSGNGHAIGAGLEYRFAIASLWVDYTRQSFELQSLDRPDRPLDGGAKMLSVGISLGF